MKKVIFSYIFWMAMFIGLLLFINRAFIKILPDNNYRILADHLVGGFLLVILFYMALLGLLSFFNPDRKIVYSWWFFILAIAFGLVGSFVWEVLAQNLKDPDQIIADILGIIFSTIYFVYFRRIKLKILGKKQGKRGKR